ncbi:MAG: helix-turn-helix domain-containing protein [Alphaproteobacteria bacterium]|nr:helix-turn-helix domain-containing protein [Alphaproteobacteria bacterium]
MHGHGPMTIGELSRRTGCKVETVRYYERIGLMPPAPRSAGRYRLYGEPDVRRLAFVRRARALGFAIDDVRTLLTLSRERRGGPCAEARQVAATHLAAVRAKIADLRAMERLLGDAVSLCATGEEPGCPVIEALADAPAAERGSARSRRGAAARRRRG